MNGKHSLRPPMPTSRRRREITLEAGVLRFVATFTSTAPAELRCGGSNSSGKAPGSALEPIPYYFFGHLPKIGPPRLRSDVQLEYGRFLFEELVVHEVPQAGGRRRDGEDRSSSGPGRTSPRSASGSTPAGSTPGSPTRRSSGRTPRCRSCSPTTTRARPSGTPSCST